MMETSNFFGVLAAIYLAPHISEKSGLVISTIFMTLQIIAWLVKP